MICRGIGVDQKVGEQALEVDLKVEDSAFEVDKMGEGRQASGVDK